MPPKKRGQSAAGRDKIFRNAVEHVHVSLGHTVLGNLSLKLAAGPPSSSSARRRLAQQSGGKGKKRTGSSATRRATEEKEGSGGISAGAASGDIERPAFYLELNEQMLSHSAKDFKKFRWEVAEMCETVPLFELNKRLIAEKLVTALLDRSGGGALSHHNSRRAGADDADDADGGDSRGATLESFDAFAMLTIAFARDTQEGFFQYFEIFQKSIFAGLFDRHGQLIASAQRLEMVFSVQASWCREMAPYWDSMASAHLPGGAGRGTPPYRLKLRALRLYVALLEDSKEYVRRLAAEVLAYVCRMCNGLATLILEECAAVALAHYERHTVTQLTRQLQEAQERRRAEEGDDGDQDLPTDDADADTDTAAAATREEPEPEEADVSAVYPRVWEARRVREYAATTLAADPVVDGLQFLIADLLRGMRGSLGSQFEFFYARVLESLRLMDADGRAAVERRCPDLAALFRDRALDDSSSDTDGGDDEEEKAKEKQRAEAAATTRAHSDRWRHAIGSPPSPQKQQQQDEEEKRDAGEGEERQELELGEGCSCRSAADFRGALFLLRSVGARALSSALQLVFSEIHRASTRRRTRLVRRASNNGAEDDEGDDDGSEFEEEELDDDVVGGADRLEAVRRLQSVVLRCAAPTHFYMRVVASVLTAADYFLWREESAQPALRQFAALMAAHLKSLKHNGLAASGGESLVDSLDFCAAFLEMLYPLCLKQYVGAGGDDGGATAMENQKAFLPLGNRVVEILSAVAYGGDKGHDGSSKTSLYTPAERESAELVLFAFAQDILQKHYAFLLREERDAATRHPSVAPLSASAAAGNIHGGDENEEEEADEEEDVGDDLDEGAYGGGDGELGAMRNAAALEKARAQRELRKRKQQQQRRMAAEAARLVVRPTLTPLALTLLHHISLPLWRHAAASSVLAASEDPGNASTAETRAEEQLQVRSAQRAVLLARLLQERTRHTASSPLEQLLRLKTAAAAAAKNKKVDSANANGGGGGGDDLGRAALQLVLNISEAFASWFRRSRGVSRSSGNSSGNNSTVVVAVDSSEEDEGSFVVELLSCATPLLHTLFAQQELTVLHRRLHASLLSTLAVIKAGFDANSSAADAATAAAAAGNSITAASVVYAQISAFVANAPNVAASSTGAIEGGAKKKKASQAKTSAPSRADRTASLAHLSNTINILAQGFTWRRRHSKGKTRAGTGQADAVLMLDEETCASVMSERERANLLSGTELLLQSLLASLEIAPADLAGSARRAAVLPVELLHDALDRGTQEKFVRVILFEALLSPAQSLRLLSLRLLHQLCRPDLSDPSRRLAGLQAIPEEFFLALQAAEEYNPLSTDGGSVGGVRGALVKIIFAAESGTLTDPLQRTILARAMVGMLYVKFSEAWTVAMGILTALISRERTSLLPAEAEADGDSTTAAAEEKQKPNPRQKRQLEPVVWDTVIAPNAHLLIFGDVYDGLAKAAGGGGGGSPATHDGHDDADESSNRDAEGDENENEEGGSAPSPVAPQRRHVYALYQITLTDQQRYERGELASKTFATVQHTAHGGGASLMEAGDGDAVLTWRQYLSHRLDDTGGGAASGVSERRSTDRATLAQTFLKGLLEMVKSSSALDRKLQLVEQVTVELCMIERNEHPSSSPAGDGGGAGGNDKRKKGSASSSAVAGSSNAALHVRHLEERLVLAMNACAAAASTVLSARDEERLDGALVARMRRRGQQLTNLFLSYLSSSNAKLQTAALLNLRRLRVAPYSTYHAQLTPYCDTTKALFHFLGTFHLESDVPPADQVAYVSAALVLALPKLVNRVAKEKRREQLSLTRRLMSFLTQLSVSPGAGGGGAGVAEVLDTVVNRLVLSQISADVTLPTASNGSGGTSDEQRYDFLSMWEAVVAQQAPHAGRHLERLVRQLSSAVQLLEQLLHAAGGNFADYAYRCLCLSLHTYLFACKSLLRAPVDAAAAAAERLLESAQAGGDEAAVAEAVAARRWCAGLQRTLSRNALSQQLARVRKGAVTIAVMLFEQFPEACMRCIARGDARQSLLGRYVAALYENSRGTTVDGRHGLSGGGGGGVLGSAKGAKSHATPMLRLMKSWVRTPILLPLVVAFAGEVVGTLGEVFAIHPYYSATAELAAEGGEGGEGADASTRAAPAKRVYMRKPPPIHKASAADVYEGFQFVATLLALSDEPVRSPPGPSASSTKKSVAAAPTATIRELFIAPHMRQIFGHVYRLIVCGAAEAGDAEAAGPKSKRVPQGKFSVMSFSVPMWREIMQTVSLLAKHLTRRDGGQPPAETSRGDDGPLTTMLGRLLEVTLRFISHPICITDGATVMMAVNVFGDILAELPRLDHDRHYRPLVHLLNTITNPPARVRLCQLFRDLVPSRVGAAGEGGEGEQQQQRQEMRRRQLEAVGRALVCLNSYDENNTRFDRYDYELRYHTFNSLIHFFHHDGNYGARKKGGDAKATGETAAAVGGGVSNGTRYERDYSGEYDSQIPLHKDAAPFLCIDGMQVIASQAVFFLRDPERTVRAMAAQLLQALLRYTQPPQHEYNNNSNGNSHKNSSAARAEYAGCVLEQVVRRGEVLASLRRGVHAKDVMIRGEHLAAMGGLGRYFSDAFPGLHRLYAPNADDNFFFNVNHVQPRCRLHALAILRREAAHLPVRDLLRVFVPFLMNAVKDFAQGKRALPNLTESKAKGYCEAVLATIAAIAEKLPWEAYYRILTLFLANAQLNPSLRMPMLKGVVQVLDCFHFLDEEPKTGGGADGSAASGQRQRAGKSATAGDDGADGEDDDEAGDSGDEEDEVTRTVQAVVRAKQLQFRNTKIIAVLQQDVIPQLYGYIAEDKSAAGASGGKGPKELRGNVHTMTNLRLAQAKEDKATSKNAILQLPVAVAITKIVKHFNDEDFNTYVDQLLDELVRKLRTKNDRHRESARRILGAMLQETGPGKLKYVVTKLKDHLVDGYQLHVLGYTVVTLLHQLYEPKFFRPRPAAGATRGRRRAAEDPVLEEVQRAREQREALEEAERQDEEDQSGPTAADGADGDDDDAEKAKEAALAERRAEAVRALEKQLGRPATAEEAEEVAVAVAEEDLLAQFVPKRAAFDYHYGIQCVTAIMDELMLIFLDDYLGETGMQKEQVELMSKMVEVKRNRAAQGFVFLARHCNCEKVMDTFIQRITWVLTPSEDTSVPLESLRGSAKVKAIMMQELRTKFVTSQKRGAAIDVDYVNKVRLLANRVARALLSNPSMDIGHTFSHTCRLLQTHNNIREEKIAAFEAKDGTRRIRGNAHMLIHAAPKESLKTVRDRNFLVEPTPERIDVDFSAHTVLATQQKQKLRLYKGRYGSLVKDAAKTFYREDPSSAVVMDTLDEFLLRYLLSVLKRVLGIGKDKRSSTATVQLDLLRRRRKRQRLEGEGEGEGGEPADDASDDRDDEDEEGEAENANAPEDDADEEGGGGGDGGEDGLELRAIGDEEEDDLEQFAEREEEAAAAAAAAKSGGKSKARQPPGAAQGGKTLTVAFTQEYHAVLESLVPAVLTTLQGEGSDAVVGNALDCLLALLSLRPPLQAVESAHATLLETVLDYFARGGPIKQRAMRVCAAAINHQKFALKDAEATRLLTLARAEVVDRSTFAPMALSVVYAVLGKHVHVPEVYDLMDIVTETLVHLSAKHVIRKRCTLILVRFLTEYKLTLEKFRSHMDLFCKNLDYPEVSGRLALLELLDALSFRLPTVVLRDEAPVLLVPLTAALTSGEFTECRQTAGRVIGDLARNAGVDVLVPTLARWMDAAQSRPVRAGAAQVWAVVLSAVAAASGLPTLDDAGNFVAGSGSGSGAGDDEAFVSSCSWSVPMVLEGCFFREEGRRGSGAGGGSSGKNALSAEERKAREKQQRKGWLYVFYSLRCAEYMCVAAPHAMYPLLAPQLVPYIIDTLVSHPHPWVAAAALRTLRHYCYTFVEARCGFLRDLTEAPDVVRQALAASATHEQAEAETEEAEGEEAPLPLTTPASASGELTTLGACRATFTAHAALVKRLLGLVEGSDVADEKYSAHRAIFDPARTELLKLLVYAWRAAGFAALTALLLASGPAAAAGSLAETRAWVAAGYRRLRGLVTNAAAPIVRHRSVVNYMVRTATLTQFFGGAVSLLPLPMAADAGEAGDGEEGQGGGLSGAEVAAAYNAAARWMLRGGVRVLPLVAAVIGPVVETAHRADASVSERIASFGQQATTVIQQQLEQRRPLLQRRRRDGDGEREDDDDEAEAEEGSRPALGSKRPRRQQQQQQHSPTLDEVLLTLAAPQQETRVAQRRGQIARETQKQLRRNRREMEAEGKLAARRRPARA